MVKVPVVVVLYSSRMRSHVHVIIDPWSCCRSRGFTITERLSVPQRGPQWSPVSADTLAAHWPANCDHAPGSGSIQLVETDNMEVSILAILFKAVIVS